MTNQVDEAFVTIRPDMSKFAGEFNTELEKALSNAEKSTRGYNMLASSISHTGQALTLGITAPLAAVSVLSGKAAIDFESNFAGVRKTVDATEEEFDNLEDSIRDLSLEMPKSASGIASIVENAGQLGIANDSLIDFAETVVMLDETTDLAADNAADSFARLANITQLPQDQFDNLGSTVVELGNDLAATESEIVDFGLRIAGAGKIAGLNQAEILGIGAAMASVGVEAEAGGTAVQKVLLDMTQAVAEGNDELEIFALTAGMSAEDFAEAFREDAAGAFTAFVEGLGDAGDDAFKVLQALGLEDQRLIRSFLSLAGAGDLLRNSIEIGNSSFEENTALQDEYAKRLETSAAQLELLENRVTDVAITLGGAMVPALLEALDAGEPVLDLVTFLAEGFASAPKGIQLTILALGGTAAAMGPVLFLMGSMITTIGNLRLAYAGLAAVQTATAASSTASAAGLATVIATARTGIPVLVAFGAALAGAYAIKSAVGNGGVNDITSPKTLKGIEDLSTTTDQLAFATQKLNEARSSSASISDLFTKGDLGTARRLLGFNDEAKAIEKVIDQLEEKKKAEDSAGEAAKKTTDDLQASVDAALNLDNRFDGLDDAIDNMGGTAGGATEEVNILEDGVISLAEAIQNGFTAAEAGAIEAADMLAKQETEAAEKAFELEKELSKLATVFQSNTKAAQQYVLALARESLEKTRAAINAVFGGPTKESAALELQLAQLNRDALVLGHTLNPQIEALEAQIERIRDAASDQRDAIADQIDVIRDESAARKKALQQQIDDYKDNAAEQKKTLQRQLDALRDKVPHDDIEEARNKHEADALEARIRNLDDATDAEVKRLEDRRDAQDDETDRQIKALKKQRDAVEANAKAEEERTQKQLDALQSQLDAYDKQTDAVQYQIDLYSANADILQKQIQAADNSLLTEEERRQKGLELIGVVADESTVIRDLSATIGSDLIPEMDAAREAHARLRETVQVLNDEGFRASLIPTIDAAAARLDILDTEAGGAAGGVSALGGAAHTAADELAKTIEYVSSARAEAERQSQEFYDTFFPNPPLATGVTSSASASPDLDFNYVQPDIAERDLGINGYANGLDYVPFDNFLARLHKGEKVLTAAEAANYRGGDTGDIIVNIDTVNTTDVASARRAVGDLVMGVSAGLRLRGGRQ